MERFRSVILNEIPETDFFRETNFYNKLSDKIFTDKGKRVNFIFTNDSCDKKILTPDFNIVSFRNAYGDNKVSKPLNLKYCLIKPHASFLPINYKRNVLGYTPPDTDNVVFLNTCTDTSGFFNYPLISLYIKETFGVKFTKDEIKEIEEENEKLEIANFFKKKEIEKKEKLVRDISQLKSEFTKNQKEYLIYKQRYLTDKRKLFVREKELSVFQINEETLKENIEKFIKVFQKIEGFDKIKKLSFNNGNIIVETNNLTASLYKISGIKIPIGAYKFIINFDSREVKAQRTDIPANQLGHTNINGTGMGKICFGDISTSVYFNELNFNALVSVTLIALENINLFNPFNSITEVNFPISRERGYLISSLKGTGFSDEISLTERKKLFEMAVNKKYLINEGFDKKVVAEEIIRLKEELKL